MLDLVPISKRDLHEYGSYHDSCGSPVLHTSLGEKIINLIPHHTQLYMRQKRNETSQESMRRWFDLGRWFNKVLEPYYQAVQDRHDLLEEVKRLREKCGEIENKKEK